MGSFKEMNDFAGSIQSAATILDAYKKRMVEGNQSSPYTKSYGEYADNGDNEDTGITEYNRAVNIAMSNFNNMSVGEMSSTISQQFETIKQLEAKVKESDSLAKEAKDRAESAKGVSVGLFHGKRDAIEALQSATSEIAEAQEKVVEAMNVSFEYQQQLGVITKNLFGLGVSNIAATRSVVQQLRMQLEGASPEEMSELAKSEILAVIHQLEAQEDMANRQEKNSEAIKKHNDALKLISGKIKTYDADIEAVKQGANKMAMSISGLESALQMRDNDIAEIGKKQTAFIAECTAQNNRQDQNIAFFAQDNKRRDEQINLFNSKLSGYEMQLATLNQNQKALMERIDSLAVNSGSKSGKGLAIVAAATSAVAFIVSIISLFV